jgi:transposase InsO family protein
LDSVRAPESRSMATNTTYASGPTTRIRPRSLQESKNTGPNYPRARQPRPGGPDDRLGRSRAKDAGAVLIEQLSRRATRGRPGPRGRARSTATTPRSPAARWCGPSGSRRSPSAPWRGSWSPAASAGLVRQVAGRDVNGYYKAELIRGPTRQQPWTTVADVELATLGWVHWHNHRRLHGYLDDRPPAEYEKTFTLPTGRDEHPVGIP